MITLVFSRVVPKSVNVIFDESKEEVECEHTRVESSKTNSPLYIAPWSPKKFIDGRKHNMTVIVQLDDGASVGDKFKRSTIIVKRQFAMDMEALAENGNLTYNS